MAEQQKTVTTTVTESPSDKVYKVFSNKYFMGMYNLILALFFVLVFYQMTKSGEPNKLKFVYILFFLLSLTIGITSFTTVSTKQAITTTVTTPVAPATPTETPTATPTPPATPTTTETPK